MINLGSFPQFKAHPPASANEIRAAEKELHVSLPAAYVDLLTQMNGGEGFVGEFYAVFWRASELRKFNTEYGIWEGEPWVLLFGGNGGGEALAFDRDTTPWRVVLLPLIGAEKKTALPFGESFEEFLEKLASGFDPFCNVRTKRV